MPRLGTLVGLLLLALPGVAHAGSGLLSVQVVGLDGRVTGTGISCGNDCSHSVTWNDNQLPPKNTLTAHVPAGFSVAWSGDCNVVTNQPTKCDAFYGDLEFGDGSNVVATFTDVTDPSVEDILAPGTDRQYGAKDDIAVRVKAADNWGVKKVAFTLNGKTVDDTTEEAFGNRIYGATFKAADIPHGAYDIGIVVTDEANRTSRTSKIPIVVDKNAPALTLTGGVAMNGLHGKGPAELLFTTGFDAASVQCSLHRDNTTPTYGACTQLDVVNGRHSATPSADGNWILSVRVADGEGNERADGRLFTVDTTDPDIGLEGGPASTVVQQGVATPIRAVVTDANFKSLECRVDGGAWRSCTNSGWQAEPNAAEGVRAWDFRATDKAGNTKTVAKSWKVDGTAPQITLEGGPAEGATVVPGAYRYRVVADDAITGASSALCAWDAEAFAPCPFPGPTERQLAPGPHTLQVRSVDGVGNTATVTRSFTVKAPDVPKDDGQKQPDQPKDGGGDTSTPPSTTPAPPPGPPTTGTPRADRTAPVLTVTAPKKAKGRRLTLTIGCSEACTGSATVSGKGVRATAKITRAGRLVLKLKKAARMGTKLTITVGVTDAAGNAATRKVTVKAGR